MVAYNFKSGFVPAILSREKQQTIRLPRKRHARPGEALQLFTGARMSPVRLGGATCEASRQIRLDFGANSVELDDAIAITDEAELQAFAIKDGFRPPERLILTITPWEYMTRWWRLTHPDHPVFAGVLTVWGDSFQPFQAEAQA